MTITGFQRIAVHATVSVAVQRKTGNKVSTLTRKSSLSRDRAETFRP